RRRVRAALAGNRAWTRSARGYLLPPALTGASAELRRIEAEGGGTQLVAKLAGAARERLEPQEALQVAALVVDDHLDPAVAANPSEEAAHERGIVASPQSPLPEHERLAAPAPVA